MNYRLLILILFSFVLSCKNKPDTVKYSSVQGETMGTTYHITYDSNIDLKEDIDKELIRINNELSTYIPTSTISKFNQSDTGIVIDKGDLYKNVLKAKELYRVSSGYYDPSVMPLVNYWGFGYRGHKKVDDVDSNKIHDILKFVGFDKISLAELNKDSILLKKTSKDVQLDLSSIAKGYGVDKLAELIHKKGIDNYLVEIGGEIYCAGHSPSGKKWVLGINTPKENAPVNDLILKKSLSGKGMATSGNYRNFYSADGHKYSHTINPKTGFSERSNLLSASIITSDCMTADALATACMVSGLDWSKKIIENTDSIEGILIYLNDNKEMKVWQKNPAKQ